MKECIKHPDQSTEFWTTEKCYIVELSNSPDDPDVSIAKARVAPGVTTRWHRVNNISERYYILSGKGVVEVGNLPPEEVLSGDVVLIPPSVRQRITNSGADDLIFLAICSPRFTEDAYEDIDDEPC